MADNNRIDAIQPLQGFPALVQNVPPNYPIGPQPGKISLLFNFNEKEIYRKYSPYTNRDSLLNFLPNKQPFVWRFPDQGNDSLIGTLPSKFKLLESQATPIKSTLDDLVRMGKFSISPDGVMFYLKQGALQLLQPYPETRLYNPLSVMLSVGQAASLGLAPRVTRHVDAVGLLTGTTGTPLSTVGAGALSKEAITGGRGLLRSPDAGQAYYKLQTNWPKTSAGGITGIFEAMKNSMKSLFASTNLIPPQNEFRADEKTYELMIASNRISFVQPWFSTAGQNVKSRQKLIPMAGGVFSVIPINVSFEGVNLNGSTTGYTFSPELFKYSQYVKQTEAGQFTNSDILANYSRYSSETQGPNRKYWQTKIDDPKSEVVGKINQSLKDVIQGIQYAGYNVVTSKGSRVISQPETDPLFLGYNLIGKNQGYQREYFARERTLDSNIIGFSKKFGTTNKSDGMNRISIIGKDRRLVNNGKSLEKVPLDDFSGWEEWKPYHDDVIAFYFYDVVNEKYIPFRATVKGISEGGTAFWDELRFIGRADQVYTYSGFSRTLSFTFNVVVSSIKELLPTWRKINYMAGAIKPSNYTKKSFGNNESFNRFMVPPMFMLTIGDLYKFQPIVIKSITMNVPDDASWETMNEQNNGLEDWNYLNKAIRSKIVGKNYAQLPREVEMAVSCDVLEKERAIVGGANFGHAPHTDDYTKGVFIPSDKNTPFLPEPTEFHKNMVEYNGDSDPSLDLKRRIDNSDIVQANTTEFTNPSEQVGAVPQQVATDPTKIPTTAGAQAGKSIIS